MSTADHSDGTRVLVCYASSEGQTATIADRMRAVLEREGDAVDRVDLAAVPADLDVGSYDGVVVGASIHRGSHQRNATAFVRSHRETLNRLPSAFFSVSLTAAHDAPEDRRPATDLLEAFLAETGWNPDTTLSVAGALKYSEYGLLTRFVMRHIAGKTGRDTDTSRDYEYTDWDDVEAFTLEFATRVA
ncbi:protoporphyrinogen oxidase [Salinadaptatus halalkaliphilus]|uniref:Protoporphyrinogen oxidase n=1 Tax=Salinadaptatus halalkaliphilus TaxID=2419781 RepID=A0A4V3VL15_9EURY|nr:flavodoxin domain-containing protein [Salinadaptatus halalkaliphilus]THE63897.1 protoporphyrinogen oxidase [Salinadaptatus halalkaliphilus]